MHYVDQGWCQVDMMKMRSRKGKSNEPSSDSTFVTTQPSLQAFTPRVRMLVQCARISKRIPLSELAVSLNMSSELLRDIESGGHFPSSRVLGELQKVLDVHLMPQDMRCEDGAQMAPSGSRAGKTLGGGTSQH